MPTPRQIAEVVFADIRAAHAALRMSLEVVSGSVELELCIPAQPGLAFDVTLSLKDVDELQLGAGAFWVSWFPCTDASVVRRYREAVDGVLTGQYRILEYRRRGRLVKAYLQRPVGDGWTNMHRYDQGWPFAWFYTDVRAVQNRAG